MKKGLLILLCLPMIALGQEPECGTLLTTEQSNYLSRTSLLRSNWTQQEAILNIPVQHHVIRQSNGNGGMNQLHLDDIMNTVNSYYSNSDIQFFNCDSINYIDNSNFYDFHKYYEDILCETYDVANVINIYYFNSVTSWNNVGICGYSRFPPSVDRIIMDNSCALNGSTLSHELGHYFSLYHTHGSTNTGTTTELVNGSNCTTNGDELCDTPADPNLSGVVSFNCEYTDSITDLNGDVYMPDTSNIMSYSLKACRNSLSSEQYNRINFSAVYDRWYLICAPILGCTDSLASNYNNNAFIDDGSCMYCTANFSSPLTLQLITDSFAFETLWKITNHGQIIESGLGYVSMGTQNIPLIDLEDGCYEFSIFDWNGMCCDSGLGSYNLIDVDGNIIISGASFMDRESFAFEILSITSIEEHATRKELLKITDLLGRETKENKNEVLFYLYDDGTVEKKVVIE
jgi:hypothetical protein